MYKNNPGSVPVLSIIQKQSGILCNSRMKLLVRVYPRKIMPVSRNVPFMEPEHAYIKLHVKLTWILWNFILIIS